MFIVPGPYMGNAPAVDLPSGWLRQIIGVARPHPKARPGVVRCRGTFWDDVNKVTVTLDLGPVEIRVPFVFRAASSAVFPVSMISVSEQDEPKNLLSWAAEDSAQKANIGEQRTERSEGVAQHVCAPEYPFGLVGQNDVRVLCNTRTLSHG